MPPPPGYLDECDDAPDPERCRQLLEGIYCTRNPGDSWCAERKRERIARNQRKWIAYLVLGALAYKAWSTWDPWD